MPSALGGTLITFDPPAGAGPGDVLVKRPGSAHDDLSNAWPFDPTAACISTRWYRAIDCRVTITTRVVTGSAIRTRISVQVAAEAADLVTEMTEIKHPFTAGIRAQQGIEF